MIGKLQRVPLRTVWRHEAHDFTVWLQENIDVLNEVLNINLKNVEREQAAGKFSVDLVAEDESSHTVIIENQLEKSDHDHLGKLITYLSSFDAVAAIWIVAEPRPEHINAINWLNESSAADFYLVKVEAVQIGSSSPAPLLTLIVGPSEEVKQVGETKKDFAERHHIRLRFWEGLLAKIRQITTLFANISPSKDSWISTSSGKGGVVYVYNILQHAARVELGLWSNDPKENKTWFDKLFENKTQIEDAFGQPLEWFRMDNQKSSRIAYILSNGGYRDEEKWSEIQANMIDAMTRLEKAMRPHIRNL